MFYKIKDVKPLDNFILKVTFENKVNAWDSRWGHYRTVNSVEEVNSDLEKIKKQWAREGYEMPSVVFWNLLVKLVKL